jgi:2-polyprenyl-3-methyl-5-hydroxy-6-metoxy-1,4-benzoquinol methylase
VRTERERRQLRELVRRGYDSISHAYRGDTGESHADSQTSDTYRGWLAELGALLPTGSRVLDLGCGAGIPAARDLAAAGYLVTGVEGEVGHTLILARAR